MSTGPAERRFRETVDSIMSLNLEGLDVQDLQRRVKVAKGLEEFAGALWQPSGNDHLSCKAYRVEGTMAPSLTCDDYWCRNVIKPR